MAKTLNFSTALARKAQSGPPSSTPRANPCQLWIDTHKPGRSRTQAAHLASVAARLLGYGSDAPDDWTRCPWWTLRYEDASRLRAALLDKIAASEYTASTANHVLDALKGILGQVWKLGVGKAEKYIEAEEYQAALSVERIAGKRLRKPRRTATEDEFARLIAHCAADHSARGTRDALLFVLAASCGFRAIELVSLRLDDYRADTLELRAPQVKVDVEADDIWLPLEGSEVAYLDAWLAIRGHAPGPLLTRLERGGMGGLTPLTTNGVWRIVKDRAAECGIEGMTPHALRRGCGTRIIERTGNPAWAQKRLRHSDIKTTMEYYYQPTAEQMREAVKAAGFPKLADQSRDITNNGEKGEE